MTTVATFSADDWVMDYALADQATDGATCRRRTAFPAVRNQPRLLEKLLVPAPDIEPVWLLVGTVDEPLLLPTLERARS
jgi:hypothetical protein